MASQAFRLAAVVLLLALCTMEGSAQDNARPRARDVGLVVGVFPTGVHNAITDVEGVRVGQVTVVEGDSVRTGVTAVVPAPGDLYEEPVPGWVHVGNGFGKLVGETQVREFGEIETPILLTCTLCVWTAAKSMADYLLARSSGPSHTINPLVGETNDSRLNDMWSDPVRREHVQEALESAKGGPVEEGSVGAGTGTAAFGWKGGMGTSSRVLPEALGGWTVGVLVQTNFGGILTMNGAPVGRELGRYAFQEELRRARRDAGGGAGEGRPGGRFHEEREGGDGGHRPGVELLPSLTGEDHLKGDLTFVREQPAPEASYDGGSIMMVVATDAPLTARNLDRLAQRAMMGLARTGSYAANSSGDYVIAFSTHPSVRRARSSDAPWPGEALLNPSMSPLFAATVEATEEAIYNAILRATTVSSARGVLEALPLEQTLEILERYGALGQDRIGGGG
jgi:D-aminopeptidase